MTNHLDRIFDNALKIFASEGRKVEGVYDLLIRGSVSGKNSCLIENYSDLDTSIVVEGINISVLQQVKSLYDIIKKDFPYKLSITIVSKKDYLTAHHHHGIKPIYYAATLGSATSLLHHSILRNTDLDFKGLRVDCFSNIAYLIHDIRNKYLTLNLDNKDAKNEFFCHLIKRTKHLIRNSIFIMTGTISEEIDQVAFEVCFPGIDRTFPETLKNYKVNFEKILTTEKVEDYISALLVVMEDVHDNLLSNYHKERNE